MRYLILLYSFSLAGFLAQGQPAVQPTKEPLTIDTGLAIDMPTLPLASGRRSGPRRFSSRHDDDEIFSIVLNETDTSEIFALPSICVSLDNPADHAAATAANKDYESLLVKIGASESYLPKHTQTLNPAQKIKETQASSKSLVSQGTEASPFEIFSALGQSSLPAHEKIENACKEEVAATVEGYLRKPGALIDASDRTQYPPPVATEKMLLRRRTSGKDGKSTMGLSTGLSSAFSRSRGLSSSNSRSSRSSRSSRAPSEKTPSVADLEEFEEPGPLPWDGALSENLPTGVVSRALLMERIVGQVALHEKHMLYRDFPIDREVIDQPKTRIEDLFAFEYKQLTRGFRVSCMEWLPSNPDVLIVGYCGGSQGLLLFWSLKNPSYPEQTLRFDVGVTSMAFSVVTSHWLALGFDDGSINVWDVRRLQSPLGSAKKHSEAVSSLKWMDRGVDKAQRDVLISAGSDGLVMQWTQGKLLEGSVLLTLRKMNNKLLGSAALEEGEDGGVFLKGVAYAIEVASGENSIFHVATHDGLVRKCSVTFSEQELQQYFGHTGPVYSVRCNPFLPDIMLTSSADWSVKLFASRVFKDIPAGQTIRTCKSPDTVDAVNDVVWSTSNSTSFAAVMEDGKVEVWDLSIDILDPIIVHHPSTSQCTCARFASNAPVLVAGYSTGAVQVMRLFGCDLPVLSLAEQQERLVNALNKQ